MHHHGPGVGQGLGLDSSNEPQEARGVIRHAVVRPAREVKLSDLPDLVSPPLRNTVIMLDTRDSRSLCKHTFHGKSTGRFQTVVKAVCFQGTEVSLSLGLKVREAASSRIIVHRCLKRTSLHSPKHSQLQCLSLSKAPTNQTGPLGMLSGCQVLQCVYELYTYR